MLWGLFFLPFAVMAGNDNLPVGARSAGLAHTSVTLTDVWSTHHNQAGLAYLDAPTFALNYENKFMLNNVGLGALAIGIPTRSGTFGLLLHSHQVLDYAENKYSLSYGRKLAERFSVGLALNYNTIRFPDVYGKSNALSADLGFRVEISKELTAAGHVYNLNRAKLNTGTTEYIPTIMRFGLNYSFSKKVFLATEAQKDLDAPLVIRAGAEYKVIDQLAIRIGVSTNPTLNAFGFGLYLKNFVLDVAASWHQTLGFTPQLGMSYRIAKKENPTQEQP
jgi:hypothetical protein